MGNNRWDNTLNSQTGLNTFTVVSDTPVDIDRSNVTLDEIYRDTLVTIGCTLEDLADDSLSAQHAKNITALTNLLSVITMARQQEEYSRQYPTHSSEGEINPLATFPGEDPLRK